MVKQKGCLHKDQILKENELTVGLPNVLISKHRQKRCYSFIVVLKGQY